MYNPQSPAMLRKKELLNEIVARKGEKVKNRITKNHVGASLQNTELSSINSLSEVNSSRVHPDIMDYNTVMESLKSTKRNERSAIDSLGKSTSVNVENQELKGHYWVKNNEFYSQMLDLDPCRHKVIENDWQEENSVPTLANKLDILPRVPGIYPTASIS